MWLIAASNHSDVRASREKLVGDVDEQVRALRTELTSTQKENARLATALEKVEKQKQQAIADAVRHAMRNNTSKHLPLPYR